MNNDNVKILLIGSWSISTTSDYMICKNKVQTIEECQKCSMQDT